MDITIRQTLPTDITALLPLKKEFEEQHAKYDGGHVTDKALERIKEDIIDDIKKEKYWLAEKDKQLIGFIKVEMMDILPDTLLIDGLFVIFDYRHKGIGTKLIAFVEDKYKTKGAKKSRLWVAKQNTEAEKLYQKLGFVYKEDIWKEYIKELE